MQKITTHLWFDKEAREAAEFYVSIFGKGSKIKNLSKLDNTPSGSVDIVTFELLGLEFQAILGSARRERPAKDVLEPLPRVREICCSTRARK